MFRPSLLLLTLLPLAAFAQDEQPEIQLEPDRKYECQDKYVDNSKPYIFVEAFAVSPEDIPEEVLNDVSGEELTEAFAAMSLIRFSSVTISETEFGGLAYQDGLDYRIDFFHNLDSIELDNLEYSIVIRADGDAAFYDFSNSSPGEKIAPERLLKCKKTK